METRKKRFEAKSLEEVIEHLSGMPLDDLSEPLRRRSCKIARLGEAVAIMKRAILQKSPINIIGDYDCDGISAAAIIKIALVEAGAANEKITVKIPYRISEGYGGKPGMLDKMETGLLILVDNGIAAHECIEKAKRDGHTVIVLDHHLPDEGRGLPPADVIIDPQALPGTADSPYYCGAGLAFRVMETLLPPERNNEPRVKRAKIYGLALAAIATKADSVPLLGDNRWLLALGSKYIAEGKVPAGTPLGELVAHVLPEYSSASLPLLSVPEDIAYALAPCFNAPGRVSDAGGQVAFNAISDIDSEKGEEDAYLICQANQYRKDMCKQYREEIMQSAENNNDGNVIVVYYPHFPLGLAGIFAGKIADKYHKPAIVLGKAPDGILHGSCRAYKEANVKDLLDRCSEHLLGCGGHAAAAGVSLLEENLRSFTEAVKKEASSLVVDDTEYYDWEIDPSDVPEVLEKLSLFAPYGAGNPMPVLRMKGKLNPTPQGFGVKCGSERNHIKFSVGDLTTVGFSLAEKYERLGQPSALVMYGTLGVEGRTGSAGFRIIDLEAWQRILRKSPLSEKLAAAAS